MHHMHLHLQRWWICILIKPTFQFFTWKMRGMMETGSIDHTCLLRVFTQHFFVSKKPITFSLKNNWNFYGFPCAKHDFHLTNVSCVILCEYLALFVECHKHFMWFIIYLFHLPSLPPVIFHDTLCAHQITLNYKCEFHLIVQQCF